MTFLIVPHNVSDIMATIGVGALDETDVRERSVRLELEGGGEGRTIELDALGWETLESFRQEDPKSYPLVDRVLHLASVLKSPPVRRTLDYQRVEVKRLKERTSYTLKLRVDDQKVIGAQRHLREARVTTLP